MSRHWLPTSSFYGTWLPGDRRGFVGRVWDMRPDDPPTTSKRVEHDIPGTPYDKDMPGLERASAQRMKGPPIYFTAEHAEILIQQFRETAAFRKWKLLAVAVMANHVHLVVETSDDVDPTKVLGDFKAYGSRAFTARFGNPESGTWWTYSGSKRLLPDDQAVVDGINYVLHKQDNSLATFSATDRS